MIQFAAPWAVLLLVVLPATAWFGKERLRRLPRPRRAVALTLRMLVLGLVVLALAEPEWRTLSRQVSVMFLVDASASVGADGQLYGMQWAQHAVASAGAADRAGLILFGAAPRLTVPLAHYNTLPDPTGDPASATNIAAAVRLGLALLPPNSPGRLVLLSDGQATSGDTSDALGRAIAQGVGIDTVPINQPTRRDVAVRAIDVPRFARAGDSVPIRITLHSTYSTTAVLRLWIDDRELAQVVDLPTGDIVLGTEQAFTALGQHSIRAQIDAAGDSVPQNNAMDAGTIVAPPGHVLLVVRDPAAATALATTMAGAHLTVTATLPKDLPITAAGYHGFDGVVLDDVPATSIRSAQQTALRNAIRFDGLGLLAIGGYHSFGEGGYSHTPLEAALPVVSVTNPRRLSAPLALMLVIDKSGSMSDEVDGVTKIDMVKVAASSALDRLSDGDGVGVLAFDDSNHWIVPFHPLGGANDKANIRRQILQLQGDGDTYIYPALQAAEQAVLSMPTTYRHIVLLTDGQGEDAPFDRLVNRMRGEHITLSTIGVGQDVVQDELRHWAHLGGGLFHYVSDPHDIPRIIVNETRYGVTGAAHVQGNIHVGVAAASPLLRALANTDLSHLPLAGYDSTVPKLSAQVDVQATSGDPILSSWQYGLGRSVAWTSDSGSAWASSWGVTRQPAFWVDAVRWMLRGYDPGSRAPQLTAADGQLHVTAMRYNSFGRFDDTANLRVRVAAPDGTARVVGLSLTGPGQYSAQLPLAGSGLYSATFVRNDQAASPADMALLAVPYDAEYDDDGVDTSFLTHVADATGGQVLARPADAFNHDGLPSVVTWSPLWPLLLALALLLFPVDVAVRLILRADRVYQT